MKITPAPFTCNLEVRLDLMLVRKLGAPSNEEFALGAIANGGIQILNDYALRAHPIDQATFDGVVARETRELLRREKAYRGARAPVQRIGPCRHPCLDCRLHAALSLVAYTQSPSPASRLLQGVAFITIGMARRAKPPKG